MERDNDCNGLCLELERRDRRKRRNRKIISGTGGTGAMNELSPISEHGLRDVFCSWGVFSVEQHN